MAASYDLPFVKQFNTGAAPLAKEIIDKLAKRFGHIRIRQAWGMTESTSALTLTPPADQTYENAHTVGKVVPETIIKIIDPEYEGVGERLLGVGESGEVLAKGPQVTMGYYNRPEATAETYDKDGFLHTGDIGFIDKDGFLMIHDRLKEMIKVKVSRGLLHLLEVTNHVSSSSNRVSELPQPSSRIFFWGIRWWPMSLSSESPTTMPVKSQRPSWCWLIHPKLVRRPRQHC